MILVWIYIFSKDDGEYIKEEWKVEEIWNRKTAQCIQMAILQDLRQALGVEATLPEDTVKDLVLQAMDL